MLWEAARRHDGVGRSHTAAREPLGGAQVASRAKSRKRLFSPTLKRYERLTSWLRKGRAGRTRGSSALGSGSGPQPRGREAEGEIMGGEAQDSLWLAVSGRGRRLQPSRRHVSLLATWHQRGVRVRRQGQAGRPGAGQTFGRVVREWHGRWRPAGWRWLHVLTGSMTRAPSKGGVQPET